MVGCELELVPDLRPLSPVELGKELERLSLLVLARASSLCGAYPSFRGPLEVTCSVAGFSRRRSSSAGWQLGDRIHLNVGVGTDWSSLVETICHEVCHYLRPDGCVDVHGAAFWGLLEGCLSRCYGVGPLVVDVCADRCSSLKGIRARDSFFEGELVRLHPWGSRVPVRERSLFEVEGYRSWARHVTGVGGGSGL